jgi:hypothetical protein
MNAFLNVAHTLWFSLLPRSNDGASHAGGTGFASRCFQSARLFIPKARGMF